MAGCDLPPEARRRRRLGGWIRPRSVLGMSFSARRGDHLERDIERQVDAATAVTSGESTSARSNNLDGDIVQSGGIRRRPEGSSGIGWSTLASVVVTQVLCLCILGFVAGPSIRESPKGGRGAGGEDCFMIAGTESMVPSSCKPQPEDEKLLEN